MTVFVSTQWSGAPLFMRAVYCMTGFAVENNPSVKNIYCNSENFLVLCKRHLLVLTLALN